MNVSLCRCDEWFFDCNRCVSFCCVPYFTLILIPTHTMQYLHFVINSNGLDCVRSVGSIGMFSEFCFGSAFLASTKTVDAPIGMLCNEVEIGRRSARGQQVAVENRKQETLILSMWIYKNILFISG